jgi:hypothetical protein
MPKEDELMNNDIIRYYNLGSSILWCRACISKMYDEMYQTQDFDEIEKYIRIIIDMELREEELQQERQEIKKKALKQENNY